MRQDLGAYHSELSYLVSRGVRALALSDVMFTADRENEALTELERHERDGAIAFTCPSRAPGYITGGFASHQWVIDLFVWASAECTQGRFDSICGLLCGYSPDAIDRFHNRPPIADPDPRHPPLTELRKVLPVVEECTAIMERLHEVPFLGSKLHEVLDRFQELNLVRFEVVAPPADRALESTITYDVSDDLIALLEELRALDLERVNLHGSGSEPTRSGNGTDRVCMPGGVR